MVELENRYKDDIPEEFICPITQKVMKDPVIGSDGHTYEKKAIMEWLVERKGISPMTCQTMAIDQLVPNIALRNAMERFLPQLTKEITKENNIIVVEKHDDKMVNNDNNTNIPSYIIEKALNQGKPIINNNNDLYCQKEISRIDARKVWAVN